MTAPGGPGGIGGRSGIQRPAPHEPSSGAARQPATRPPAGRPPAGRGRWLQSCAAAAVLLGLGAWLGLWWLPFVAGVAAALTSWPVRSALSWAVLAVIAGWGVVLWIPAVSGAPAGATAREVAALAGLPPHAFVAIAVTLAVGALQSLTALWLTRALRPRQARNS